MKTKGRCILPKYFKFFLRLIWCIFPFVYVSIVLYFSINYMIDTPEFRAKYATLISIIEASAALYAFVIFYLDRFDKLKGIPERLRTGISIITLTFVLLTLPHLYLAIASDVFSNSSVSIVFYIATFLMFFFIILYALKMMKVEDESVPIAFALLLILIASLLIYSIKDIYKERPTQSTNTHRTLNTAKSNSIESSKNTLKPGNKVTH